MRVFACLFRRPVCQNGHTDVPPTASAHTCMRVLHARLAAPRLMKMPVPPWQSQRVASAGFWEGESNPPRRSATRTVAALAHPSDGGIFRGGGIPYFTIHPSASWIVRLP